LKTWLSNAKLESNGVDAKLATLIEKNLQIDDDYLSSYIFLADF